MQPRGSGDTFIVPCGRLFAACKIRIPTVPGGLPHLLPADVGISTVPGGLPHPLPADVGIPTILGGQMSALSLRRARMCKCSVKLELLVAMEVFTQHLTP